jgi:hypothetical protein
VHRLTPVPSTSDDLEPGDPCFARYSDGLWWETAFHRWLITCFIIILTVFRYPAVVEAATTAPRRITVKFKQYADTSQVFILGACFVCITAYANDYLGSRYVHPVTCVHSFTWKRSDMKVTAIAAGVGVNRRRIPTLLGNMCTMMEASALLNLPNLPWPHRKHGCPRPHVCLSGSCSPHWQPCRAPSISHRNAQIPWLSFKWETGNRIQRASAQSCFKEWVTPS